MIGTIHPAIALSLHPLRRLHQRQIALSNRSSQNKDLAQVLLTPIIANRNRRIVENQIVENQIVANRVLANRAVAKLSESWMRIFECWCRPTERWRTSLHPLQATLPATPTVGLKMRQGMISDRSVSRLRQMCQIVPLYSCDYPGKQAISQP